MTTTEPTERDYQALQGLAPRQYATWGDLESMTHGVAGRRRLARAGLVEQHPDYSGCVILTGAGARMVRRMELLDDLDYAGPVERAAISDALAALA